MLKKYKKAIGRELKQAWLILSNEPEKYKSKLFLNNLLIEFKEGKIISPSSRKLWLTLASGGFYLHPSLEEQYLKQRICFFCSGEIVTRRADTGNYEEVCAECGYLYLES